MAIQIRRGNDAEWESNKSNIVAGEPAVTLDSERMFVGTGSGTYMELANLDVLADAFDSSASYEVGDFVAYHGKVYKFNTDHSGAWNASDVDEVALADELDSLGEDVYTKAEADALLALKADASDVNSALALKADKSDTYTKTEVNTALALKADKSDTYTKAQVDTALGLKSDKADTYTKEQVDAIAEQIIRESEYSNFEMKSVSGDFIHITDGAGLIPVKDLKIGIDAVQDLHGQSSPYPSGGDGIQIWDEEWEVGSINISDGQKAPDTSRIRSKNNISVLPNTTYYAKDPTNGNNIQAYFYDSNGDYIRGKSWFMGDFTTPENASYMLFIMAGTYGTTYKNDISINYPSTNHDYHPWKNICPISGWTGAKVSVNGINQWDEEWEVGGYNASTGIKTSDTDRIRSKNLINVIPSTEYRIHFSPNEGGIYVFFCKDDGSFISALYKDYNTTFTTPANCKKIKFCTQGAYGNSYKNDISINYPSSNMGYYKGGTTYSVTWEDEAGTVYGGTLDVTTGEGVITFAEVDLGTLQWSHPNGTSIFYANKDDSAAGVSIGICSAYPVVPYTSSSTMRDKTLATGTGYVGAGHSTIVVKDSSYSDAATFKNAMDGMQLVYKLATPITFTIDPTTDIVTLLGENNIFADTGAVEELIYRISNQ